MDKKATQLGLNPSTASGRLVKDLLFSFVKDTPCYRCGGQLTRESFSIDHKIPWLDSEDPSELFFDLNNISYSHHSCNVAAGRRPHKKYATKEEFLLSRLPYHRNYKASKSVEERQAIRKAQYARTGK